MPDIITRADARSAGLKYYFTNQPCKRGHISTRAVSNLSCTECVRLTKPSRDKAYYEKHKDKVKATVKRWTQENLDRVRTYRAQYYKDNSPLIKHKTLQHYYANWERCRASRRLYYQINRERIDAAGAASTTKRRAQFLRAIPSWFERAAVKDLYRESARLSRETGIKHHVDHIIPLRSELVCGLHCLANLRIVTAAENLSKSNKLIDDLIQTLSNV